MFVYHKNSGVMVYFSIAFIYNEKYLLCTIVNSKCFSEGLIIYVSNYCLVKMLCGYFKNFKIFKFNRNAINVCPIIYGKKRIYISWYMMRRVVVNLKTHLAFWTWFFNEKKILKIIVNLCLKLRFKRDNSPRTNELKVSRP